MSNVIDHSFSSANPCARQSKKCSRMVLLSVCLALMLSCLRSPLYAQFTSGTLTGTVLDPSGAVVTGATITARDQKTGAIRGATTNASGLYTIPSLQPDEYALTATAPGFATMSRNVTLTLGHTLRADFHLEVSSSSQRVTVSAQGAQLETENHAVGDVVQSHSIENLPSSTLFQALTSATNVAPYQTSRFTGNANSDINFFRAGSNSLLIGGSVYGNTSFLQDGVQNFNLLTETANLQPSIEATQAVNVVANGASARFDRPNVVNVITKSGTNAFHGRLYDFLRNDALNAIGELNVPKPALRYNRFGANIGGPIVRNKLFFFFDYSGLRDNVQSNLRAIVPTTAERQGDFSADSATIYDPATYDAATGTIKPFPGNVIPKDRISAFSSKFLQYYPLPTGTSIPKYNYITSTPEGTTYDSYLGRIDYQIGPSDSIYGAYETTNPVISTHNLGPADIFNSLSVQHAKNAYIQETHVFGPSLVNVARMGYNRSKILQTIAGVGKQDYVSFFGINNLHPLPEQWAPPHVGITGYSGIGDQVAPDGAVQNLFQYADEVNWTVGKHYIYFGAELDRFQFNGIWTLNQNGNFSFNGQYTSNHAAHPKGGSGFADFLLGYPNTAKGSTGIMAGAFREYNFMPYIQDNWHILPKLTLNLGLRYDYYEAPSDKNGHSNVYVVATNTNHPGTYHQNYKNLAPRVGFAYAPNTDNVFHGGYGIYYTSFMYNNLQFLMANEPNFILQAPTHLVTQLIPVEDTFVANPASSSQAPFTTSLVMPTPYVQQWNLSWQHSFGRTWILSLSYLGSKFLHQEMRLNSNQARVPEDPNNPGTIQSRRPYSWVGDVNQIANVGQANYNGLQVEMQRRYSNGLSLRASYVWSKAMDYRTSDSGNVQNGLDPSQDYGRSDFNRTNVFKFSPIYELPFGSGKSFLNGSNWIERRVIGGFQVSGIFTVVSGYPFSVLARDLSLTGTDHTQRANQVCNGNEFHRSFSEWFNTACYVQPGVGELGNERRNTLDGPRNTNLNLSLFKSVPLKGDSAIQFRADLFSALNHPLPLNPTSSTSSSLNGQITSFGGARVIQLGLKIIY